MSAFVGGLIVCSPEHLDQEFSSACIEILISSKVQFNRVRCRGGAPKASFGPLFALEKI